MKNVKMLGLAAMGVIVLTALFGASSASAAVACKTNADPCGAGWDLGVGASASASLQSEASLKAVFSEVKCKKSSVEAEVTNTGGKGKEVQSTVTSLSFTECKCGERTAHVTTTELGSLKANDAGTVTNTNTRVTINCTGLASCIYGSVAGGTDLGTVTDGEPGVVDVSATITWSSGAGDSGQFVCAGFGDTGTFAATYTITNPSEFYISNE